MMKSQLNKIFGAIVLVTLLLGGLSLIGYIIAFFIGVENATILCEFIQKKCYPYMIQITSIGIGIGLISMYLSGKKALIIESKKEG